MRVLIVAPPRRIWPYVNEQDNYLLPQWMACLGAVVREAGLQVRLIDCMPEHLGWRSLAGRIRAWRPDVIASGENHALFAGEVCRLVELAKTIDPEIVTVVGGSHFTVLHEQYLTEHPIDLIVRGEGELTFRELLLALADGDLQAARDVDGVAYRDHGEVITNPPRALVADLDDLPMPAYDLLPMERYGKAKYLFSPGGATIHHSRGCVGSCRFCAWWRQMARRETRTDDAGCRSERLVPHWRTKSVERTLEEMALLHRRYGKRCLVFVDPTFNVDPDWNDAFAEALLSKSWDLSYFAFLRADLVLRDERLGVFEKLVRSGLIHVCIGVERVDDEELKAWNKTQTSREIYEQTFAILREKYPQVFRQATFIVGTRDETPESMEAQFRFSQQIGADYPAFHPVTPFPGTDLYEEALSKGWLEITDFEQYDLMTPVMRSSRMTRDEIDRTMADLNRRSVGPRWLLKGLLSRSEYRRNMYIWWLLVTGRLFADSLRQRLNPFRAERYTGSFTPDWYDD